jgi:hypothetical protein
MSRDNSDYNYPYNLTKLNTTFLPQDQKFYFSNQEKNILQTSRPQTYFPTVTNDDNTSSCYSNSELASSDHQYLGMDYNDTRKNILSLRQQNTFSPPSITNDDSTSSCCSISELASSDHQYLGVEDHDTASDQSPDSPKTPTNGPFGVNNVVNISYPWSLPTVYESSPTSVSQKNYHTTSIFNFNENDLQQQQKNKQNQQLSQEIISPVQSSPSSSSCLDYIEDNKVETREKIPTCEETETAKKGYQRKSKEEIFLKFKLPKNGIATRTRSKKSIPNQDPPSVKKKHHLSEEEKVLQKYSFKVADIPPFSRKVTLPSNNSQVNNNLLKNSNYPIPKSRSQILSNWTYHDQKKFLSFYLSEGKNFGQLAKSLNKSTKEVVEFYYYFKMSKEFRTAKSIKKDLLNYSAKLDHINDTIIKLKQLSTVEKTVSSPATRVHPTRVTFAPIAISKKRRGRPKKSSHVRGGLHYYY